MNHLETFLRFRPLVLAAMLAAAFAAPPARAAAEDGVTMAPASAGGVRFSVQVPEPQFDLIPGPDGFTRMTVPGWSNEGLPGEPALPARVITIAVPPLGEVRLSAVGSEPLERSGTLLAPSPVRGPGERAGEPAGERLLRSPRAYERRVPLDQPRARVLEVSWLRNQRVARILIEPASYDPADQRVRVSRRVDVSVQVDPMTVAEPAEARDPFEDTYRALLPNYEQGLAWRRPATASLWRAARERGLSAESAFGTTPVETTSVFAGRHWVRLSVRQSGFHKVNFSQLRAITTLFPDTTVKLDSLRLFTLPGYPVLPEDDFCDQCDYREVAIGFKDVYSDGIFGNNSDAFYFFALGSSDWADTYDAARPDTSYINNPYDARNFYYLTVSTSGLPVGGAPRRIASRSGAPVGGETEPLTYEDRIHFERDEEYWPDASPRNDNTLFWEKWFWRSIDDVSSPTYLVDGIDLADADTTQSARFRMRVWGLTALIGGTNDCDFSIYNDHLLDVSFNGVVFPRRGYNGFLGDPSGTGFSHRAGQTWDTSGVFLRRTNNALRLFVPYTNEPLCPVRNDRSGLAWFDLFYARRFVPVDDSLEFRTPTTPGSYVYRVGPFRRSVPPRVFDVTDPQSPVEILGGSFGAVAGGYELLFSDTQASRRRIRICPDSLLTDDLSRMASADVAEAPGTSLRNLRSVTNRADYLLVYYDGFGAAADSLLRWRRERLPYVGRTAPFDTMSVPISALFDQFSGGRTDPAAIRNFLRGAFLNWVKPPAFVQFLGDASYDFKNIKGYAPAGQPGSLVPSYESGFDPGVNRQFATDDWLLNFDDARSLLPDFFGGRLPCVDANNALDVVTKKILAYERTAPLGEYRNHVLLVADDNLQNGRCDGLTWNHLKQSALIDTGYVSPHFDRDYVYLHTYPQGPNFTRPGARAALKDALNAGVSVFNYFGHGSPFKIADESVFLDSDAGTLTNVGKLTLFAALSCDVGKFNDPSVTSLGERMVLSPTTGAIGVISATELAYSNQNEVLAQALYARLFERGDLIVPRGGAIGFSDTLAGGGQYHVPISAALLGAKVRTVASAFESMRKYQVMGDAATAMNFPKLWVELDLRDAADAPVTTLQRGGTYTVRGRVLDRPGGALVPFDGVASILIEDSAPTDATTPGSCSYRQEYRFRAGPMFRGDVSIAGGQLNGRFVVPLDAVAGDRGRVRAYVTGRPATMLVDTDGAGSIATGVAAGTAPTGDNEGPRIVLGFQGGATRVRPDATLRIELFDPSGIMITGHSLQNSIVVTVDDNTTQRVDVTSSFRYAANSYQSGIATFTLPGLSPGPHRISVTASDNLALGIGAANHRSSATLEFEVVVTPELSVRRTFLFPNPTRSGGAGSGGQFVVDAPGDPVNAMVRIYTLSGRLVRTLKTFGGQGQVQLGWDGLDDEGDRLAQGTYLFKVYVSARDEDGESSARQKASAEGRFVILN